MQMLRRNDKEHQREQLEAYVEAQQAVSELHKLLAQPGKNSPNVGKMVSLAARIGLLRRDMALTR
jgi:hypothetical protein